MSAEFLQQLYSEVLGREPDPAGFAHNLALLESGAISASEMANAFAGSQEAQSNAIPSSQEQSAAQNVVQQFGGGGGGGGGSPEQILNKAYQDVFGRSPDPSAQGWLRDINAGLDLEGLKSILARTPEAREKALQGLSPDVGQNDPNNFVSNINQLYMSSLGRLPDKESLVSNLNLLNQNPDAFGWLAQHITNSPEAQKYAEKTGIDQTSVYGQVTSDYGKWTPAASSPMPGGLGGLLMKTGPYLPFALAAAAAAPTIFGGAGATGTAAGGAGAAGAGFVGLDAATAAQLGLSGGSGLGTAGASGNVLAGIYGAGSVAPGFVGLTPEFAAELGLSGGSGLSSAGASGNVLSGIYGAGEGAAFGMSDALAEELGLSGGSGLSIEGAAGDPLAGIYGASPGFGALSTLGSILSSPLGRLGAMGGLSLLSGGGAAARQPVPQMAGGGGTFVPRGQVDYTPILNLLAPRQISRNSLLG